MEVRDRVIAIIAEKAVLAPADVTMQSSLSELGVDSLAMVEANDTANAVPCQSSRALSRPMRLLRPPASTAPPQPHCVIVGDSLRLGHP